MIPETANNNSPPVTWLETWRDKVLPERSRTKICIEKLSLPTGPPPYLSDRADACCRFVVHGAAATSACGARRRPRQGRPPVLSPAPQYPQQGYWRGDAQLSLWLSKACRAHIAISTMCVVNTIRSPRTCPCSETEAAASALTKAETAASRIPNVAQRS